MSHGSESRKKPVLRISELCRERDVTQRKAARALDISENTFSQYATGAREPNFETIIRIADYFDCSLDRLLGRPERVSPDSASEAKELAEIIIEYFHSRRKHL